MPSLACGDISTEPVSEAEVLLALDLPYEALALFLDHIDNFCAAHGGSERYSELMALTRRYRAATRRQAAP